MASFPNQNLTNGGWDALADALAGQRLKFMRMAVGDGRLPEGANVADTLAEATELVHHVMDLDIIDYRSAGQGKMFITGVLRSSDVATGFYLREIGLWVTLTPQGGNESLPILYSINNAGDSSDYIPARDEASVVVQSIEVQVIISKAPHVEVIVVLAEVYLVGENIGEENDEPGQSHPAGIFKERVANRMRYRRLNPQPGLLGLNIVEEPDEIKLSIVAGTGEDQGETGGQGAGVVMTGTLLPFAGANAPLGYLFADGRLVSREAFPGLFAVVGTTFGAGDGSTTFGLPDCRGRTLVGAGSLDTDPAWGPWLGWKAGHHSMTLAQAHMPAHAHLVDIQHMHNAIVTGNHNHGDPGHAHYSNLWHGHAAGEGDHYHNISGQPIGAAGNQINIATGVGNIMASTHWSYSDVWVLANWAAGWTDTRGCGLWDAGNLGGYTGWVDNPSRATDTRGSSTPFSLLQPSLGVNYIIKT